MNIVVHRVDIHLAPVDLSPLIEEIRTMTDQLQRLTDSIAAEDTVITSAITLISGIAEQIRVAVAAAVEAALAAGNTPPDVSALTALADDVDARSAALAAAVSAGTTPTPSVAATGGASTGTDVAGAPVKVIGAEGAIVSNNTGAAAFDPPIPGTPGPFDGAAVPVAPNSPAPATDPADTPTGETATNVANPPSDSTLDAGMVDATSGVDQTGTITDVGTNGGAGAPGTASEVPAA